MTTRLPFSAIMAANPRKFSEKIALHTQKQAEETAAFEAILREVSETTRTAALPKTQHLPQPGAFCRGGSLPNVNQIGSRSIDLQAALNNLEDIKQGQGRQSLIDRLHRDPRSRQVQGHRRAFPFDKRIDVSPYGSTYLSPPADSNWRRTNSDSALHTSATAPQEQQEAQQQHVAGDGNITDHRRDNSADSALENSLQLEASIQQLQQQLQQSRPKSCEVPGINIYPSPEQDSAGPNIPISNNTGSLPDLSNLHFPAPLITPLDSEEQSQQQQAAAYAKQQGGGPGGGGGGGGSNAGNLSPTSAHHHIGVCVNNQQSSPGERRRQGQTAPSPLVLHGSPNQLQHNIGTPQGTSIDVNTPWHSLDYSLHPPPYHPYHSPQRHLPTSHTQNQLAKQKLPGPLSATQLSGQHIDLVKPNHAQTQGRLSMDNVHGHCSSPDTVQGQQPISSNPVNVSRPDKVSSKQGTTMPVYRNSTSDHPQSPTSPLSQHSYSPSQSPGLPPTTISSSSAFTDTYYIQQQAQTSALQHQFEQFNMENPQTANGISSIYNTVLPGSGGTVHFTQAVGTSGSPDYITGVQVAHSQQHQSQSLQQQTNPSSPHQNCYYSQSPQQPSSPQQQHSPQPPTSPQQVHPNSPLDYVSLSPQGQNNNIPDIIFTGADETLAGRISNAMASMSESFDSDLFASDEALKVGLDPLDLDGIQMLTENMVTDPATEDSFRLDRL